MASGLVTVAGNNPGYASVLEGLGSLALVSPKDISEFAKRMELLLCEPQLRRLWLSWAKQNIAQYDYPEVVDQYEAIYNDTFKRYG
jgi:glycosyltransferase involved in cell wall biosynthesis